MTPGASFEGSAPVSRNRPRATLKHPTNWWGVLRLELVAQTRDFFFHLSLESKEPFLFGSGFEPSPHFRFNFLEEFFNLGEIKRVFFGKQVRLMEGIVWIVVRV